MNFDDPQDVLLAKVKLRGSLDGAPQLWWYRGFQYGIVDRQPTLLWQVEGAQLGKYVAKDDGSYDHVFHDVMFYLEAESGELLTTFANPYTDETHEPPIMRMGPFTNMMSVKATRLKMPPNMPPGALEVDWRHEPIIVQGDDIYIRESATTKIANQAKGKPGASDKDYFFINDFFTLTGKVSDLENRTLQSAPAYTTYESLNEWTPWMAMGNRPGMVLGRGSTQKLSSYDQLPDRLRGWIDEKEPSFFEDPEFSLWGTSYTPLNQDG